MRIKKNTVVSINYELSDLTGRIMEKTNSPISYLHGGYNNIFPIVEEALQNMEIGNTCCILMEPENHFGEHQGKLIRVEPREAFPENLKIGMQFEGSKKDSENIQIYTVTDIAEDKVVVDGNHPLAGMALRFDCTVTGVRYATAEELAHEHAHESQNNEN
jgi:FKBP-type peptidyl-prolyl cis-trans isomerase SlyD